MNDPIAFALSLVVLVLCAALKPQHAQCPGAFNVAGVFADGSYTCRLSPPERGPIGHDFAIVGRVYCAPGVHAFTRDWERVSCD